MSICTFVNKTITREEPLFKKCCFCIPLRTCLQTWACVKVVANIALSCLLLVLIMVLIIFESHGFFFKSFSLVHAYLLITVILLVDGCFIVALSVGLFMKSLKLLRIFYYYSLCMVAVSFAIFIVFIILAVADDFLDIILSMTALCSFINFCFTVCIILTVNSEFIKLRNKQQYEFFKMQNKEDSEELEKTEEQLNV